MFAEGFFVFPAEPLWRQLNVSGAEVLHSLVPAELLGREKTDSQKKSCPSDIRVSENLNLSTPPLMTKLPDPERRTRYEGMK